MRKFLLSKNFFRLSATSAISDVELVIQESIDLERKLERIGLGRGGGIASKINHLRIDSTVKEEMRLVSRTRNAFVHSAAQQELFNREKFLALVQRIRSYLEKIHHVMQDENFRKAFYPANAHRQISVVELACEFIEQSKQIE